MNEKCLEVETLRVVTSGSGSDKDTVIYVIPFDQNEAENQVRDSQISKIARKNKVLLPINNLKLKKLF
jgi:hypothetical protein